ncbi:MAG: 16S rRNA (cytosine(1402)-N(4))-methyltransferase RsmH [Myxococcota bacterium]|jgi:16S rRNA (cytosine1402-N4)-methyltransferase|nr:16S rRNA (cytosine(1402)-N(4))-methyltransferase RsmH [Myxococcota bacterium]
MSEFKHIPVLLEACRRLLTPQAGHTLVDVTLGGAGHARALASALESEGLFIGLDRDPDAIAAATERLAALPCRKHLAQANFEALARALEEAGLRAKENLGEQAKRPMDKKPIDRLLADLGVSSHQLETPSRGFSFRDDGPLDMRMEQSGQSAATLLAHSSEEELARILAQGDVPRARSMARAIKAAQQEGRLESTGDLRRLCEKRIPARRAQHHPATLVFQAIRMAVNRELESLVALLEALPRFMAPGGRVGIISFHSGEDRIVKQHMRAWQHPCVCPPRLPMCACGSLPLGRSLGDFVADDEELSRNPRARSARLRVFEFDR